MGLENKKEGLKSKYYELEKNNEYTSFLFRFLYYSYPGLLLFFGGSIYLSYNAGFFYSFFLTPVLIKVCFRFLETRFLLKKIYIKDNKFFIQYFFYSSKCTLEGAIEDLSVVKKPNKLSFYGEPYLIFIYNKKEFLKQYEMDEWDESTMEELVENINFFKSYYS